MNDLASLLLYTYKIGKKGTFTLCNKTLGSPVREEHKNKGKDIIKTKMQMRKSKADKREEGIYSIILSNISKGTTFPHYSVTNCGFWKLVRYHLYAQIFLHSVLVMRRCMQSVQ